MFTEIVNKIVDGLIAGGKTEREACCMVMLLLKTVISDDEIGTLLDEYEGIRFS